MVFPVEIHPRDLEGLRELMAHANECEQPLCGKNENGETTFMDITHDEVIVTTWQDNGHIRVNHHYADGTEEELFEGVWK